MMRNIDKTATRENIPAGNTLAKGKILDFTVPVIDNFGDMGFALSLAVSLLEKQPGLHIRFFSENRELFEKMLGENALENLEYFELSEWKNTEHSEIRFNFFGYKIREEDVVNGHPKRVLNFDYLQFHRDRGTSDPGIASIHGTKYEVGTMEVTHIVPSPLEEGAGVVVPNEIGSLDRSRFLESLELPYELAGQKWCSVFAYPATLELLTQNMEKYPDWTFLVCGDPRTKLPLNAVSIPFLSLAEYSQLLNSCDANIVRGENSLVSAMLAGKPFLWDIYRESNGAHEEKIRDFGEFVDRFVPWGKALERFTRADGFETSVESLLRLNACNFSLLASTLQNRNLRNELFDL